MDPNNPNYDPENDQNYVDDYYEGEEGYQDDPNYPGSGLDYDPNFDDTANVYDDDVINSPGYHDELGYHDDPNYDYPLDESGYPVSDIPEHIDYGDADPYLDALDDDDEDVYLDSNDIRNRHKNATTEIPSSDPKDGLREFWMKNCVFCCTCVLLLVGIILLGVRINQIGEEASSNSRTSSYTSQHVPLRPPPLDLSVKCTGEKVTTEQGFYECEMLCEAADCCNYPVSLALSCLRGNDDECLEYHEYCSVLQLESGVIPQPPSTPTNVPTAPKNIKNTCNEPSLMTVSGFEACVDVCMQAECCWKNDGTVHVCTSNPNCDGYAPCLTMKASNHVDSGVSKEIQEKCADDNLLTEVGRNQCIFACSHAACCFDPNADCPHENDDFCGQYSPCGHIYDKQGNVIEGGAASTANEIPTAPQFLETACSESSLNTLPGYEMCQGACSEAECCWKGTASCSGEAACTPYKTYCVHLLDHANQDGTANNQQVPPAPSYIAESCSEKSLDEEGGFELCRDICMKAECCWKSSSCNSLDVCAEYTSNCAKLVAHLEEGGSSSGSGNSGTFIPLPPSTLDQTCGMANIVTSNSGYKDCQDACRGTECCWKTNPTCADNANCSAWSACSVLNRATQPPQSTSPPTSAPQSTDNIPASGGSSVTFNEVFDACLNHNNNVANGKTLCESICDPGACCFTDSSTCPSTVDCSVFSPCEVLHQDVSVDIEEACSEDGDRADCVAICSKATCCFTNDVNKICVVANPTIVCEEYKPCEILYQAEVAAEGGDTSIPGS